MSKNKLYLILHIIIFIKYDVAADEVKGSEDDSAILSESQYLVATKMNYRSDDHKGTDQKFSTRPVANVQTKTDTKHIVLTSNSEHNAYSNSFNDEYWPHQWYAHDQRVAPGPVMDHNLVPVYLEGYRGRDVVIGIISDGVYRHQEDLYTVLFPEFLDGSKAEDVQRYSTEKYENETKSEGTRMAGVIAMVANNTECGAGVAFEAKIVGIKVRYESPEVEDYKFVEAITYGKYARKITAHDVLCDIYAFGVGRPNDGIFMRSSHEIQESFKKGASQGRKDKGSIYVVGAGDGKTTGEDNCGADDLANDLNTIVVASADHRGKVTPYSERCAAVTATAYSGGDQEGVVTIDVGLGCIKNYTGNNPSVAIAAGIFALVLESKPDLTAREMLHLIAMTAEVAPLVDNPGTWTRNKAGFYYSNDFGFGLLNAENMVVEASKWTTGKLPLLRKHEAHFGFDSRMLEFDSWTTGTFDWNNGISYTEQVELIATVKLQFRGSLTIKLKSNEGTEVVMLEQRPRDRSGSGLNKWRIKTSHFWGEDAGGKWTVSASIGRFPEDRSNCGLTCIYTYVEKDLLKRNLNQIKSMNLVVYGTFEKPQHYREEAEKRTYSAFYSSDLHGKRS